MKIVVLLLGYLVGFIIPTTTLANTEVSTTPPLPVMLYFSRSDCPYCHSFEEEILEPLVKSGAYAGKIIIRKLVLDGTKPVENFNGELVSPAELGEIYRVEVTPTLLFVDSSGDELAPRILGYQKTDFYAYFL
jgi:thioredoxin-related protein